MKKSLTLMGMSGVGKTTLSQKLAKNIWFHYSGDYRIATHYLADAVGDFLKVQAMQASPLFAQLLKADAINVQAKIRFDNLGALSAYIGKLGRADLGGLDLTTFLARQRLHHAAEVAACYDLAYFQKRAKQVYGYEYFIYDAGGSFCELEDEAVFAYVAKHSELVYIHADDDLFEELTQRAIAYPKPLYYNERFLLNTLAEYEKATGETVEDMRPDDFIRYVIPKLTAHRREKYRAIAKKYGTTICAKAAFAVQSEAELFDLIAKSR